MTIYKQPSSPYYYYDFYSKSGDIKPPPISETRSRASRHKIVRSSVVFGWVSHFSSRERM